MAPRRKENNRVYVALLDMKRRGFAESRKVHPLCVEWRLTESGNQRADRYAQQETDGCS